MGAFAVANIEFERLPDDITTFFGAGSPTDVIARGEPHPVATHLDLGRFAAGRTVDERGIGPFPFAH